MASAAYQYGTAAPARAPRTSRPRVTVTPGGRTKQQESSLPGGIAFAFLAAALVILLIGVVSVVRLGMYAATVETKLSTQQIESSLEEARYVGTTLEVQQTSLSGMARIKTAAAALEMVEPSDIIAITLPEDVVVTDAAGNLSLTGSINVATTMR